MNAILAIGSPFGADRVGWQIADHLIHLGIEAVHTCRHPIDLLPYFSEYDHCTVIDAMWANQHDGALVEINPGELKQEFCRNTHGLNLYEVIKLADISDQLPKHLAIYGIEINGRSIHSFSDIEVNLLTLKLGEALNLDLKDTCPEHS